MPLRKRKPILRNFPINNKEFALSGRPPRYIATTVGREIQFYHHRFEVSEDGILKQVSEPINILSFDELLEKYGLVPGYKPKVLDAESFRKDFLCELTAAYNLSEDKKIEPEIIKNVSWHILNYLKNQKTYVNRYPYTELDGEIFRQEHVRDLHKRFDLIKSLSPEIAEEFRSFILRSFQGTKLNQYLTEQCVIAFMFNLFGEIDNNWKILDFECGSGGFLAAAVKNGSPLENIVGIDIDELPYAVAKTFLALYFGKTGKEVDKIPVKQNNGLFFLGNDWDVVIGNPAGSAAYDENDIDDVLENLERDINQKGRDDNFSQYNFSIQQAVRSCKVGGKICLVLPDGFFSTSRDEFLRKYVAKYCKILAIISLPRGVFKKGRTTKSMKSGSQTASMKMSILYAEKTKPVIDGAGLEIDESSLQYPVFLANINKPESTAGTISDWLEPRLNLVFEQWKSWQTSGYLTKLDESLIKDAESTKTIKQNKKSKKDDKQMKLLPKEPLPGKKLRTVKSKVSISKGLDELFKKK